jgi:mannose-1-phosphate guanylyltransferase
MKIIIFCGGSGTRMWPMSRKSKPKQFQPLTGEVSMFKQQIDRLLKGYDIKDIFVSTGKQYKETILSEVPELSEDNLILEPEMRDTLGCVGYAVMTVQKKHPDSVIATMWGADHYIRNSDELIKALIVAEKIASQEDLIVNIDAKPSLPNVNLGYMEMGKLIKEQDGFSVFEFIRQVEKPDLKTAQQFVRSFKYLWHVGYAVFKSKLMIDLYKTHAPEVYEILKKVVDEGKVEEYLNIPKNSVDFGIYEKLNRGQMVEMPVDLGWSDVGAWNILKDELAENGKANVVKGDNYDIGSIDCLTYELTQGKIIATIGLENLIIVDTPDALLVCSKFKSQEVKKIVERLKSEGKDKYL